MHPIQVCLLVVGMALSANAPASGFCDDPAEVPAGVFPDDETPPHGGECVQELETPVVYGRTKPVFADALTRVHARDDLGPLTLTFDGRELSPARGPIIVPVSVMELVADPILRNFGTSQSWALLMSVSRGSGGWTVQFDLLPVPKNWSIVNAGPPAILVRRFVHVPSDFTTTRFAIKVEPTFNWSELTVLVEVAENGRSWQSAPIAMTTPYAGGVPSVHHLRLRTGVLGPVLNWQPMRSWFSFPWDSPYIGTR